MLPAALPTSLHDFWNRTQAQLVDAGARHGFDWPAIWQQFSAEQQAQAQKVLTVSQYVAESLPRDADWFKTALLEQQFLQPLTRNKISPCLDDLSANAVTEEDWQQALRKLRRRAMVNIIWRDVLRLAKTLETTRALSDLADECVIRSLEFLGKIFLFHKKFFQKSIDKPVRLYYTINS